MLKIILTIILLTLGQDADKPDPHILIAMPVAQRKVKPKPAPKKPTPRPPAPDSLGNCNSALWSAQCAVAGPVCVAGSPNQGCLQEGDNCTNCYRAALIKQPKIQPRVNIWLNAPNGTFKEGEGWTIHNPGGLKKRGLKAGDIITHFDGLDVRTLKVFKDALLRASEVKKFRVRREREIAAR